MAKPRLFSFDIHKNRLGSNRISVGSLNRSVVRGGQGSSAEGHVMTFKEGDEDGRMTMDYRYKTRK